MVKQNDEFGSVLNKIQKLKMIVSLLHKNFSPSQIAYTVLIFLCRNNLNLPMCSSFFSAPVLGYLSLIMLYMSPSCTALF